MKILFADIKYDYGKKERGINAIGEGVIKSIIKLGYDVIPFYYDEYLEQPNYGSLQVDLINKADEIKPDLIVFCLMTDQFKFETLDYLKSKYKTLNWFGDDQWRFDDFTSLYAPHFTYCVTTDKFCVNKYPEIGQNNVVLTQWAAINEHEIPEFDGEYEFDVSFIGGTHYYRKWFVDKIAKSGINIQAFGHGWANGAVSSQRMNDIFVKSKINLNISNSTCYDARYLLAKPMRHIKHTLKSSKNQSQIKARNFEIPYFNGFQLTDYVPGIEDYFDIGREIVCYSNVDEAIFLINYYLKNENLRENIKNAGHKKAVGNHGYIHRWKEVLEKVL